MRERTYVVRSLSRDRQAGSKISSVHHIELKFSYGAYETLESRSDMSGEFANVMLEKNGDQLDR